MLRLRKTAWCARCCQQCRKLAMCRGVVPTGESISGGNSRLSASLSVGTPSVNAKNYLGTLPPWPVDTIEFNTKLSSGGHDIRREHERKTTLLSCQKEMPADNVYKNVVHSGGEPLQPQSPTEEQWSEVRRVEKTEDGARVLAAGGWVCGSCFRCMPHRSRSVCDFCHVVRHDAVKAVGRWREDPTTWFCSQCGEFNFERDMACRSCNLRRDEQLELRVVHHERLLDEIQRAPVGSVIVTRNRITRWRCSGCSESNALQSSLCRYCSKERFDFTVSCPSCKAQQTLSNRQMYGSEPADHIHVSRPFGLHNCFPRLAPEQRCGACRGSLHGATASTRSDAWLCACGHVGNAATLSCPRCRLPRRPPGPAALAVLLRVWDFAGATNWYCEGCGHVNKASRHIVALERHGPSPLVEGDAPTRKGSVWKAARTVHGFPRCEDCGLPWHHQLLNGGKHWRCACHKVNPETAAQCQVCQLPAVDDIWSDVLSFWSRGDWYCVDCQRQNYRERRICVCGAQRPAE